MMFEECLLVMCCLCVKDILVFIVFRGLEIFEELIIAVKENGVFVLCLLILIFCLLGELFSYLDGCLVVWISVYGVLVDVYGFGVLI